MAAEILIAYTQFPPAANAASSVHGRAALDQWVEAFCQREGDMVKRCLLVLFLGTLTIGLGSQVVWGAKVAQAPLLEATTIMGEHRTDFAGYPWHTGSFTDNRVHITLHAKISICNRLRGVVTCLDTSHSVVIVV